MDDHDAKLHGIGGWLLFFLLTFAVFTPARAVIETLVEIQATVPTPEDLIGIWSMVGIYLLFTWAVTAWFVLVRRRSSVWVMIAAMWIETLAGAALLALVALDEGVGAEAAFTNGLASIAAFIYPIVWTAYLLKSRRVANTYAGPPLVEDVEETFA